MASKSFVLKYLQIADTFLRDLSDAIQSVNERGFNIWYVSTLFFAYRNVVDLLNNISEFSDYFVSSESFHRISEHRHSLYNLYDLVLDYQNKSRSVSIDNLFNDVFSA